MSSEIYRRVESIAIKNVDIKSVYGTRVPQDHPFQNGLVPAFSVGHINPGGEYAHYNTVPFRSDQLIRVSPIHGRSYELRFGETASIFWQDQYGNLYSTLTSKGNNLESPEIQPTDNYPSGFFVYGLQDGALVKRAIQASRLLRKAGVETEIIIKVMEPKELPFNESLVSPTDLKKGLLAELCLPGGEQPFSPRALKKAVKALEEMRFLITVRGLQVSERLTDLVRCENTEEFVSMMQRVFTFVNMGEKLREKRDSSYHADYFNAQRDKDIQRYLTTYIPMKIGQNMAKMHNLGLAHKYPTDHNISAAGSIYDLDSVYGEPLGDKPLKRTDYVDDIEVLYDNLFGLQQDAFDKYKDERFIFFDDNFLRNFAIAYRSFGKDRVKTLNSSGLFKRV